MGKGGTDTSTLSDTGAADRHHGGTPTPSECSETEGPPSHEQVKEPPGHTPQLAPRVKARFRKKKTVKGDRLSDSEAEGTEKSKVRGFNWVPAETEALLESAMPKRALLRNKNIPADFTTKVSAMTACYGRRCSLI